MDPKKWKLYQSAFIKSIRRGLIDDAVYWGILLFKLGHAESVWRRIFVHLSEDIGLAEPNIPANIEALYNNYNRLKDKEKKETVYESENMELLPYAHAIMLLASSKKSRCVDHAQVYHFYSEEDREVPDYAIDHHSPMGRRMGRDLNHFREVAARIENVSDKIKDIWEDKAYYVFAKKLKEGP